MLFLAVLAGMTLLAVALVLTPLLRAPRGPAARDEADLRIYRDQLAEVEVEHARGAIGAGEAEAARHEIERRIVRSFAAARAGRTGAASPGGRRRPTVTIAAMAVAVPVVAGGLYALLGAPGASGLLPWEPSVQQREVADFDNLLQRLEQKVRSEPNRVEGWVLLGRMYDAAQRFADAGNAFDRAAALKPDNPDIAIAAAQSRIMAAGGTVTPDAVKRIDRALALDPHHPGARYFKALAQWQAGQRKAAYAAWSELLRDSPADAPWLPQLRARVTEAAGALGLPPPKEAETAEAAQPGPDAGDMARAARMTPEQRQAMIRSMVASLAARLKAEPDDLNGWMRLGRSYGVLGEHAKAVDAFEHARKLAPQDPDVLVGLGRARAEAGDRAGALAALREARAQLGPDDPRRDQVEQTIRAFQPAAPKPR